ncbi:MAG: hypothetical protein E7262_05255 [Lachnospiraceae bacterium]|nr:hypothetical protein [Lachnospiraceae bacterium]
MTLINDSGFFSTPLIMLLCIFIIFIVNIMIWIYLYTNRNKHPEANTFKWFVLSLFLPLVGLFGYLINLRIAKNA